MRPSPRSLLVCMALRRTQKQQAHEINSTAVAGAVTTAPTSPAFAPNEPTTMYTPTANKQKHNYITRTHLMRRRLSRRNPLTAAAATKTHTTVNYPLGQSRLPAHHRQMH